MALIAIPEKITASAIFFLFMGLLAFLAFTVTQFAQMLDQRIDLCFG